MMKDTYTSSELKEILERLTEELNTKYQHSKQSWDNCRSDSMVDHYGREYTKGYHRGVSSMRSLIIGFIFNNFYDADPECAELIEAIIRLDDV